MPKNKSTDPILRHLSDKDDKISEEDIRNVNTNVPAEDNKDKGDKEDIKDHPKKEMPSDWDILDVKP